MSNEMTVMEGMGLSLPLEVASFFNDNASAGMDNINSGGTLPQLKTTQENSKNEQENGQFAAAGTLFHAPTKQARSSFEVSIVSISRPFYTVKIDQKTGEEVIDPVTGNKATQFNQMVGGVILETMQPFVMIVKGTALQNMWDFGETLRPYTKNRKSPVPMFAFAVKLGTERIENSVGFNYVATYEPIKDEAGNFKLITDIATLPLLRMAVDSAEDIFEGFISRKEVDRVTGEPVQSSEPVVDITPTLEPEKAPDFSDDIPF